MKGPRSLSPVFIAQSMCLWIVDDRREGRRRISLFRAVGEMFRSIHALILHEHWGQPEATKFPARIYVPWMEMSVPRRVRIRRLLSQMLANFLVYRSIREENSTTFSRKMNKYETDRQWWTPRKVQREMKKKARNGEIAKSIERINFSFGNRYEKRSRARIEENLSLKIRFPIISWFPIQCRSRWKKFSSRITVILKRKSFHVAIYVDWALLGVTLRATTVYKLVSNMKAREAWENFWEMESVKGSSPDPLNAPDITHAGSKLNSEIMKQLSRTTFIAFITSEHKCEAQNPNSNCIRSATRRMIKSFKPPRSAFYYSIICEFRSPR